MKRIRKAVGAWRTSFYPALIAFSILSYCSDESPVRPVQTFKPEVSDLIAPAVVYSNSPARHIISVKVADPQGLGDIDDVSYEITKVGAASASSQGELFDDGFHGDVIAKDGRFSNLIQGSFAQGDSGAYEIEVTARDREGNASESLKAQVFVLRGTENLAPQILQVTAPSSVAIDSAHSFLVAAQVSDPEGLANSLSVTYQFFPPEHATPTEEGPLADDGTQGDVTAGDGVFTTSLRSSLFTRLGDHFLRIEAQDTLGNRSPPQVVIIEGRPRFSNKPVIADVGVPRMVNGNETSEVVITAEVTDLEGLSDIDTVLYHLFLPDGEEASDSPRILLDDGTPSASGDTTAGDGVFSNIFEVQGGGTEPIVYRLVFEAKDRSARASTQVVRQFVVSFDDAPFILNLDAPSLVRIDPDRDQKLLLTIDARDPQGQADIVLVQFRSFLPDGSEASNSPTELFDDGVNDVGDGVAGDGIYSRFIFLPSQGVTPGDFRFVFEARDQTGLGSNVIEHILTVVQ